MVTTSSGHLAVKLRYQGVSAEGLISSQRVSNEQIHSSACGSAIEINYDEERHPHVPPFVRWYKK